jgi:predicted nucleic acid-binding protein
MADATVLIALGRIGRLDLLSMLELPVLVTQTVWEEVAADSTRPGVEAIAQAGANGLLQVSPLGEATAYPDLDAGESTTLSAASELGAAVIIDEWKARRLIRTDPRLMQTIPATLTTVTMVLRAKREGLIPTVRPILDQLRQEGLWLKESVYQDALRAADEAE